MEFHPQEVLHPQLERKLHFLNQIQKGTMDPAENQVSSLRTKLRIAGLLSAGLLLPFFDLIVDCKKQGILYEQLYKDRHITRLNQEEELYNEMQRAGLTDPAQRALAEEAHELKVLAIDETQTHNIINLYCKALVQCALLVGAAGSLNKYYLEKKSIYTTLGAVGLGVIGLGGLFANYLWAKCMATDYSEVENLLGRADRLRERILNQQSADQQTPLQRTELRQIVLHPGTPPTEETPLLTRQQVASR